MIAFNGSLSGKQNMPKKSVEWGIKIGKNPTSTFPAVDCMKKIPRIVAHGTSLKPVMGRMQQIVTVVKRTADRLTGSGLDLVNAEAVYDALHGTGTSVKVFYVPEMGILQMDKVVPKQIVPIPDTMTI